MRNKVLHIALAVLLFMVGTGTALAEDSLTTILDAKYGPGTYQEVTNTNGFYFNPGSYDVTAILVDKQSAYANPTGWYEVDSQVTHELFSNPPTEVGTSQTFDPQESFGIYINSTGTFYSDDSLNNAGTKRAKIFKLNTGGFVVAFEDGTDWDYQDIVVELKGEGLTAIPEFPTVALPVAAVLGLMFIFGRKNEKL